MRVRWMLALLAAALLFGGFIAGISYDGVPIAFGLLVAALLWFVAVALAAVLLAEAVQNDLADSRYARFAVWQSCDD